MDSAADSLVDTPAPDPVIQRDVEPKSTKTPYKSFKKKYRKMEIQFAKVMARSEELYRQNIHSKKTFDRVLREKTRLLDILLELNESPYISSKIQAFNALSKESTTDTAPLELSLWNSDVNHLASLYDNSFELSEDESNASIPRNPMSLLEWLRRNQPNVFSSEAADTPVNDSTHANGTSTSDAHSNTSHSANGTSSGGNAGHAEAGSSNGTNNSGNNASKSKKKRKAGTGDAEVGESESKPQAKKPKKARSKTASKTAVEPSANTETEKVTGGSEVIITKE